MWAFSAAMPKRCITMRAEPFKWHVHAVPQPSILPKSVGWKARMPPVRPRHRGSNFSGVLGDFHTVHWEF